MSRNENTFACLALLALISSPPRALAQQGSAAAQPSAPSATSQQQAAQLQQQQTNAAAAAAAAGAGAVIVSQQILQALGIRSFTPQVTACPGCGRTTSTFFQDMADQIQTYLRELRVSDLNGSAGLFRLKEELTRRVNTVISPSQVNAVLFKEIVIQ